VYISFLIVSRDFLFHLYGLSGYNGFSAPSQLHASLTFLRASVLSVNPQIPKVAPKSSDLEQQALRAFQQNY
jgi:hypothetical protein